MRTLTLSIAAATLVACGGTDATRSDASGPVLQLTGCTNFGAVFPVPMDSARAVLPPGFEPIAASNDPTSGATLYVLGLRCDDATLNGVSQGAAKLAYSELAVTPPPEFVVPDITDYTVPVFFTATPLTIGDALAQLHVGFAGPGDVTWSAGAISTTVQAALGNASLTLSGEMAPVGSSLASGSFVVFGVQDRAVRSVILGSSEGGVAVRGDVRLQQSGAPAPLPDAQPIATGFSVSGFNLGFTRIR